MNWLVMSAQSLDSGSYLRAKYFSNGLRLNEQKVTLLKNCKAKKHYLHFFTSIIPYLIQTIKTKFDVAVFFKLYPNIILPALISKYLLRKKIVIDVDDLDWAYNKGTMSKFVKWFQKTFINRFDIVTYHNDLLKQLIIKEFKVPEHKIIKLNQGVDLNVFKPTREKVNDKLLVYVAHLNAGSYVKQIIASVKMARKTVSKLNLVIVGGGEWSEKCKDLVWKKRQQRYVKFTGYVTPEECNEWINKAGACLLYYGKDEVNNYRCSMKLREYLAVGKKVVCTNVGELKSFEDCTYQTSTNIMSFANTIKKVIVSQGDGREYAGEALIKRDYDWKNITKKFLEEYNDKHNPTV